LLSLFIPLKSTVNSDLLINDVVVSYVYILRIWNNKIFFTFTIQFTIHRRISIAKLLISFLIYNSSP